MSEPAENPSSDTARNLQFERKVLVSFALLCLLVAGALVFFPSLWQALANPYEAMTLAMSTIAELCRW